MSAYEEQILNTSRFYDQEIQKASLEAVEVLRSDVTGSRVHQIINNPFDEGIDEG